MKSALSNLLKCKVSYKTKKHESWDKKKYLIWVFLGRIWEKTIVISDEGTLEFEKKTIAIFEVSTLEIFKFQSFPQK